MPQTTIWLQADLHRRAKEAGLNVSRICQAAIRAALPKVESVTGFEPYYETGPDGEIIYVMTEEDEAALIADAQKFIEEEMSDL
jgi:hypothetical protein